MIGSISDIGKEPAPLRWSNERYMALVESGVIEEGRGVELIDGQVIETMPQGKLHNSICLALLIAFRGLDFGARIMAPHTTVVLVSGNTFDPEYALLREGYDLRELPRGNDVEWVIEVSVTSRRIDLGPKRAAYGASGVPVYWVVDAERRGIHVFSDPSVEGYRSERFVPAGEPLDVPGIEAQIDTGAIFPAE